MPVTKSELIEQLSESLKLPKGKAELVVKVMFDAMVGALERGERIEIRGFGSFEVRSYKPYEGRNPRTGEPVQVKAKRLPFFKVGKELRERVNASTGALEAEDQDDHDDEVVGDDEMGDDDDGNGNGTD
jgi:integration host factor subunit beta